MTTGQAVAAMSAMLLSACARPERLGLVPALKVSNTPAWYHHAADSIGAQHPVEDAQAALSSGDCHLFGVVGFMLIVPGLGRDWQHYPGAIRVFPGSDAIEVDGQLDYQTAAAAYAGRYNRVILADCRCMPHAA